MYSVANYHLSVCCCSFPEAGMRCLFETDCHCYETLLKWLYNVVVGTLSFHLQHDEFCSTGTILIGSHSVLC